MEDEYEELQQQIDDLQARYDDACWKLDNSLQEKVQLRKQLITATQQNGKPQEGKTMENQKTTMKEGLYNAGGDIGEAIALAGALSASKEFNAMLVDLMKAGMDKADIPKEVTDGAAAEFFMPLIAPLVAIVACDMWPGIPASNHIKRAGKYALTMDGVEKLQPILESIRPQIREIAQKARELSEKAESAGVFEPAGHLEPKKNDVVNEFMSEMGQKAPVSRA